MSHRGVRLLADRSRFTIRYSRFAIHDCYDPRVTSAARRYPISAFLLLLALAAGCAQRLPASGTVDVQLLAFNDFHGAIEPPAGANGRVGQVTAGGVEYLAAHLRTLAATNPNTVIVSAGDNIGATPLLSGMFHDEPSIEALSSAGLFLSAVGNHELDEGWDELYRMQKGGCHPVDGCQDKTPFAGATFRFLAANLMLDPAAADPQVLQRSGITGRQRQTLFPPYTIRDFNGVKVGFIGLTLRGVGAIVSPAAMKGLTPTAEADAANEAARMLSAQGVHTIVVLIHEGGYPQGDAGQENPNTCENFRGPIIDIANAMSSDIDLIVSGHTHRAYVCTIGTKLVTSAMSMSRLVTDIDLRIDRQSGRVVSKSARNVTVTRDVTPSSAETALIEHYRPFAAAVVARPVGKANAPIPLQRNSAGESAVGDIVADGMLEAARAAVGRVDFALTNSGGLRSDLIASAPGGTITFADAFNVLPFGNVVIVKTMTGEAIVRWLEQQFVPTQRVMQPSAGFSYEWDASKPDGNKVNRTSIMLDGKPLVPTEKYRVASIDFVWNGGDGFTVAANESTDPAGVGTDVDVFVAYLGNHSPVAPGPQNRIRRVN
jgi:5'-nucleotidase